MTVQRSREEVERLWQNPGHRPEFAGSPGASIRFNVAPGDRGTEIHVDVDAVRQADTEDPLAKIYTGTRAVSPATADRIMP